MGKGIFDGLEDLGLDLSADDIYRDPAAEEKAKKAAQEAAKIFKEEDFLFEKTYECPVCSQQFKERTLRTGKARLLKTDMDLKPTFEGIEPLKYDVVQCTECGYTALTRYFGPMTSVQRKNVIEKICSRYKKPESIPATLSYEDAISRYKLALANAMIRVAKASEKAYICLRAGWLVRSYVEVLAADDFRDDERINDMKELENEFLKNAFDGFVAARQSESFPMCGMDETTLDYLVATLAIRFKNYDVASKLVASILYSTSANARIKDKARDLKDEIVRLKKEE